MAQSGIARTVHPTGLKTNSLQFSTSKKSPFSFWSSILDYVDLGITGTTT
jgi:hypothetical protein